MAKLSRLYASALFELALESGSVDAFMEQAAALRDVLKDKACLKLLLHPHIRAGEKLAFFSKVLPGEIAAPIQGFLRLVFEKRREAALVPAVTELITLIERHQRKTTALVISADELGPAQTAALQEMLSAKLDKQVTLDLKTDPSLVGGLYIQVDGYFIDCTVKKRLRDMAAEMKAGCGA
jgi:F-type H+-transporting ATPase subunit delta